MRHGANLTEEISTQVWSTSVHKTNIRTREINNNNQNSIETIKGRIESVFGSESTANAVVAMVDSQGDTDPRKQDCSESQMNGPVGNSHKSNDETGGE